jgi:sulfide:quinone oxidoreductase
MSNATSGSSSSEQRAMRVLIAGGGVAGLECLMALRDLAEDRVEIALVAPEREFELKALRTAAPFGRGVEQPRSLARIAAEFGADLLADTLESVRADKHEAVLASGTVAAYDALVLAVGARPVRPYDHALAFGLDADASALAGIVADLEQRYTHSVAFVVTPRVTWPLPLYELALMTAADAWSMGVDDARVLLVTPESAPLAMFGAHASAAVAKLLHEGRVEFHGSAYADVHAHGRITVRPGRGELHADRVVAAPLLVGPGVVGVPADADGFIPTDDHGRARGLRNVYAVGDGADFPIKQGGLACQMADAAAAHIARAAGADVADQPFRPVLRGKLLTGAGAEFLRRPIHGGAGEGRASEVKLWWPPTKVSGRYLSAWLEHPQPPASAESRAAADLLKLPADVEVEVPLPDKTEIRRSALRLDPYSPIPALGERRDRLAHEAPRA